jgi:hypothetical protein
MSTPLTIDALRATGRVPRLHPAGFVQFDLEAPDAQPQRGHSGGLRRLHVWDESIQATGDATIHDHVFDMRSRVLTGCLLQHVLTLELEHGGEPTHELYTAAYGIPGAASTLQPSGVLVRLAADDIERVPAGTHYVQPAFTFHRTEVEGLTATVMEKITVHDGDARVLMPLDGVMTEDRREVTDPAPLWELIDEALRRAQTGTRPH